jgi:hypothetical protein
MVINVYVNCPVFAHFYHPKKTVYSCFFLPLELWVYCKVGYKAIQKIVVYILDGTFKWHCYELITDSQNLFFGVLIQG